VSNYVEIFSKFFENGGWAHSESVSGTGSSLAYTEHFRKNLVRIIKQYDINSIFDCSCGDWNWMKEIKSELPFYIGNDAAKKLIEKNNRLYSSKTISFIHGDMLTNLKKYEDKKIDLIICRHTFEHISENYCIEVINEIKRVSKYALITTNNNIKDVKNSDIKVTNGHDSRAVYLHLEPYMSLLKVPIENFYDSIGEPQEYGCFGNFYKF